MIDYRVRSLHNYHTRNQGRKDLWLGGFLSWGFFLGKQTLKNKAFQFPQLRNAVNVNPGSPKHIRSFFYLKIGC